MKKEKKNPNEASGAVNANNNREVGAYGEAPLMPKDEWAANLYSRMMAVMRQELTELLTEKDVATLMYICDVRSSKNQDPGAVNSVVLSGLAHLILGIYGVFPDNSSEERFSKNAEAIRDLTNRFYNLVYQIGEDYHERKSPLDDLRSFLESAKQDATMDAIARGDIPTFES